MGKAQAGAKNTFDTNERCAEATIAVLGRFIRVRIYPATSLEQVTARNQHSLQQRRMPREDREIIEICRLGSKARRLSNDRAQYPQRYFELAWLIRSRWRRPCSLWDVRTGSVDAMSIQLSIWPLTLVDATIIVLVAFTLGTLPTV